MLSRTNWQANASDLCAGRSAKPGHRCVGVCVTFLLGSHHTQTAWAPTSQLLALCTQGRPAGPLQLQHFMRTILSEGASNPSAKGHLTSCDVVLHPEWHIAEQATRAVLCEVHGVDLVLMLAWPMPCPALCDMHAAVVLDQIHSSYRQFTQ